MKANRVENYQQEAVAHTDHFLPKQAKLTLDLLTINEQTNFVWLILHTKICGLVSQAA
jgi:hypothetical protein